ncbi:MAG: carbohydrate kinase [Tannerella sp.]|jgi:fructokinase|nr:carbohydrate kinase [Tannerella sp.]
MRKVIGIGETILDIIFENGQPERSVVGGSVLNGMVSLSRLGVPVTFVSEAGDDRVGDMVCGFMAENGIHTDYIDRFKGRKSPVSLAFLDADRNAEYIFHTDYPEKRLNMPFPEINEDDIFVFGSFYALNPLLRKRFAEFLEEAARRRALIYYDPNFRPSHKADMDALRGIVSGNCAYAAVVRGSDEDFFNLYGRTEMDGVYSEIIRPDCRCFITTHGAEGVTLYADGIKAHFDSKRITPVSTIGAGDNFNAGIVYGLLKYDIGYRDIPKLGREEWAKVIQCGIDLSAEVCCSYSNYISPEFAAKYGIFSD